MLWWFLAVSDGFFWLLVGAGLLFGGDAYDFWWVMAISGGLWSLLVGSAGFGGCLWFLVSSGRLCNVLVGSAVLVASGDLW